jgi:hypothetical protein
VIDLSRVSKFLIPLNCAEKAYLHMRTVGAKALEGVGLFAGVVENDIALIKEAIIPAQKLYSLEGGLMYAVENDELFRINVHLHSTKQILLAQIHSHPGRAYHSEMDDAYPIITKAGALSIVVPDFAAEEISLARWAVYRLIDRNAWINIDPKKIIEFI